MPAIIQNAPPVLQSGKFRHRVKILQPTRVQDATGGTKVPDVTVVAEVWASVETLSANERLAANEFLSHSNYKVVIRWRSGVTAKMYIQFENRLLFVQGVSNPDGRHKLLILACLEIADGVYTVL